MENADRYKREYDLFYQQIEEMEERHRAALLKMNQPEHETVFIELISSKPILALLAAVPLKDQREIIDSCLRAWDDRVAREE